MSAMAMGIAQGALGIFSGLSARREALNAAAEQYNTNRLWSDNRYEIKQENLLAMADEVASQAGMQLTDLAYDTLKAQGTVASKQIESEVFGNTAARNIQMVKTREALTADNIAQAAEAKTREVNSQLRSAYYSYQAENVASANAYNNTVRQQPSTFDIVAGGVGAGVSAYSQGLSLENAGLQNSILQNQYDKLQGVG